MTAYLHKGDLPADVFAPGAIAVDCEAMGLNQLRDRLCVVQLSDGWGDEHLVQFPLGQFDAPNLKAVLTDPSRLKILHFARFDVALIQQYLGIVRPCGAPRSLRSSSAPTPTATVSRISRVR